MPFTANSQETESIHQVKNSNGEVALTIKMKDGEVSIEGRNKAASPTATIFWGSIGFSITRNKITSEAFTKNHKGVGPVTDAASSGIAYIYFDQAKKTWYRQGDEIVTTITFSEEQIKTALKDDFSDLKKGTTIYLHGIFRSYENKMINGVKTEVNRKYDLKNWKDIMEAEWWSADTLAGFLKYYNMPIKFIPKLQNNSIYYVTENGTFIAPKGNLANKYIDENVTWSNEPTIINYYDDKYNIKGYYVTKKLDNTKTWIDQGFTSTGKNINQIISGQTKVFLGGVEVYLVYEKEKPPDDISPDPENPGSEPLKESIISNIELPNVNGKIGADPKNREYFEVSEGIPTTESLYTEAEASPYLLGYHLEKKVGTEEYPVKVKKEYILFWTEQNGTKEVNMSQNYLVEQVVNIKRPYAYWEVRNFDLYSLKSASINNFALPGETSVMEVDKETLNIPDININHSSLKEHHIIIPDEIINGITLKTQTIYGKDSKPSIPSEDLTDAANRIIPNLKVKNDSLVINGQHIIKDTIAETEGLGISDANKEYLAIIKDGEKAETNQALLLKENLVIDETKENGVFHSSGMIQYNRVASKSSKYNESLEYNIPNVNSLVIHTPVVCNILYSSDNNQYVQKTAPSLGLNLVLDNDQKLNDFSISISNQGFHLNKKGYGMRDYSFSLRDETISYIAVEAGALRNEIKFPFDVYKQNLDDSRTLVEKNTWIILDKESQEFSLPIWVNEGSYTAKGRSIAANADMYRLEEISEQGANTKLFNYVATSDLQIEVSGRVFDLTIYDITDYPVWQDVFRIHSSLGLKINEKDIYLDGTRIEDYQKNFRYDYRVGTKDQDGNESGRLAKYTFPLVEGSHPVYNNQGILKTGYGARFRLTTIGNMYSEASSILIKPRFYHVDSNGENRQEINLFYEETVGGIKRKLIQVGNSIDEINVKFQEVGSPYTGISKSELENTAKLLDMDYQDLVGKREGLFTFDHIQISSSFRTFPIEGEKYIQNWYGYYYLPSILYVSSKDIDVYDYAKKYGVSFHEDFWLKDGYIIVNFDIVTIDGNGQENLSYINKSIYNNETYNNMWQTEGFKAKKISSNGVEFNFQEGDFLIYRIDSSIHDDYMGDGL